MGAGMRWEELFTSLEAEVEADERAELAAEVAERTRWHHGQTPLLDRIRAVTGRTARMDVAGAGLIAGRVASVGPDWVLLETDVALGRAWSAEHSQVLVVATAVREVTGLGRSASAPEGSVSARFGLTGFLRGVARERRIVSLVRVDGAVRTGRLDRVGSDHVDISDASGDEALAAPEVRTLALSALAVVRLGT